MDQKFKDEFLKVGITEHLLPVIERLFSHTAGRFCRILLSKNGLHWIFRD